MNPRPAGGGGGRGGGRCAGADARTRGERIPCQTRAENRLRLGGTRGNEGVLLPFQT